MSRRLSPKSDEGGSETQAEAQHHGKGRARGGMDGKPVRARFQVGNGWREAFGLRRLQPRCRIGGRLGMTDDFRAGGKRR